MDQEWNWNNFLLCYWSTCTFSLPILSMQKIESYDFITERAWKSGDLCFRIPRVLQGPPGVSRLGPHIQAVFLSSVVPCLYANEYHMVHRQESPSLGGCGMKAPWEKRGSRIVTHQVKRCTELGSSVPRHTCADALAPVVGN